MMDQNSEIRIVIFEIFWNFQKGVTRSLCGRSGHYGRGQTRAE